MGIKPRRHLGDRSIVWAMADQVFSKPSARLQKLYGNPRDHVMMKEDGNKCSVTSLKVLDVHATEDTLEAMIAEQERDSSLGFLPVLLEDGHYRVHLYRMTNLPDEVAN